MYSVASQVLLLPLGWLLVLEIVPRRYRGGGVGTIIGLRWAAAFTVETSAIYISIPVRLACPAPPYTLVTPLWA
jgi:hypothetical protein